MPSARYCFAAFAATAAIAFVVIVAIIIVIAIVIGIYRHCPVLNEHRYQRKSKSNSHFALDDGFSAMLSNGPEAEIESSCCVRGALCLIGSLNVEATVRESESQPP
ncbi:unnamed protein product [Gongylonema pulchrum]|uniref:Uncharacterized protein n=1 Tax=Gongylonema pulchrum TaxID=637853 RepID=A0A183EUL1_9BILA|nr:unnamed protein product [Gongylonema pulchrum]